MMPLNVIKYLESDLIGGLLGCDLVPNDKNSLLDLVFTYVF
jgi:hypothetical protein